MNVMWLGFGGRLPLIAAARSAQLTGATGLLPATAPVARAWIPDLAEPGRPRLCTGARTGGPAAVSR